MIHPHTRVQFVNDNIGMGLFATHLIPKGTIIWCLDKFDQIFSPDQVAKMPANYQDILDVYSFRNEKGEYVLCWDNTKYINHSSNSNCLTTAFQYEIAIRDIHPGEQLFNDYGYLKLTHSMQVEPEEGSDRTEVHPDDLLTYYNEWDDQLKDAYRFLKEVKQPLKKILSPELWKDAIEVSNEKKEMASIILNYFYPNE